MIEETLNQLKWIQNSRPDVLTSTRKTAQANLYPVSPQIELKMVL